MSAGTPYTKRFGGGFIDLPSEVTPIDQQFLNAVEAALLQLLGAAPTADGQVAQWDFANTRFGPALLLNKNIDPAAAIAKSKLDFTGANGIVNSDIAGAAAIARSKLNFGAGLVNADIAATAAIAYSKLNLAASIARTDMAAGFKFTVGTLAAGPPGGPTTNDIWIATDVDANGTVWCFRYNSAEATYKWEFIGGSPAYQRIASFESTTSSAYGNLTTPGPTFTIARAGDYLLRYGALANYAGAGQAQMTLYNSAGLARPTGTEASVGSSGFTAAVAEEVVFGLTAGFILQAKYASSGGANAQFAQRFLSVQPVRIS
jgi:hypothetical protein